MYRKLGLIALAALAVPQLAHAVATCPDRNPAAITIAAAAGRKCQDVMSKAGIKFLKIKTKTLAKCRAAQPAGACPLAADVAKIEKTVASAGKSIARACSDDAAQAGLASSYNTGTDDAVITSCMLSQHSVVGELVLADSFGPTTEAWPSTGAERADCVTEIGKQGPKFLQLVLKAAGKCLSGQSKAGTAGDLAPICLGSFAGGVYVAPTDAKAAKLIGKAIAKTDGSLTKKCGPAETLGQIASIFACPGAATVADLQACLECDGLNGMFDVAEQQYAERGKFVANGPGAIQTAVSAAGVGDKLLIGSGDYSEEVNVTTDNLSIVGCGAATNDRPRIIPITPQVQGRGFRATAVNGLLFQSLDFFDQSSDHIFVGQAQGATFRDITGDGNRHTRYAVFPVMSNNVLVELCSVRNQSDAPLYIGQSSGIVVRHNDVRLGVSGIEIENSGSAQVYGNYGTGNTAGLLVFKDGSLPVQLAQCHSVHHNLFESNNEPNFGAGTVSGVPTGTGILVISADTTPYSYNWLRKNNTAGLTLTDQVVAAFGPPFSPDESLDNNYVFSNVMQDNGLSPDPDRWPLPFGADLVLLTTQAHGNCENGNVFGTQLGFNTFAPAADPNAPVNNAGTCVLPPPAVFPGCPAPPVTTTTSTTSTTTSSTTSTT